MSTEPKLEWTKQSHSRYSANLGPLHLEVRKIGIIEKWWCVGEVFGRKFHDRRLADSDQKLSLYEAQVQAEKLAREYIRQLREATRKLLKAAA